MTETKLGMVDFARALARRGLREDALLILDLLPEEPSLETLDLRARVLTQLGRYAEAEDGWGAVQKQCPEHQGAADGLAMVAGLRKSRLRRFRVWCALRCGRAAAMFLALLLVVLLLVGAGFVRHRLNGLATAQAGLAEQLATRNGEVEAQLKKLRKDAADLASLQLRAADAVAAVKGSVGTLSKDLTTKLDGIRKGEATGRKEVIGKLAQAVTAIKTDTAGATAATKAELAKLKTAQEADAKAMGTKVASLLAQQKGTAASLAKLTELSGTSGAALGKSLQELSRELTALKPMLVELSAADSKRAVATTASRKALAAQIDALGKRLDEIVAGDPTQRLTDLTAQYIQLRAGLSTQSKRTTELTAQLKSSATQAAALGKAVAALEKRLAAPPAAVPTP